MAFDLLHILPTPTTPEVILNPKGIIKIKGRALSVSSNDFPEQIMNGIDAYLANPPDSTDVVIGFEYLNSFSAKILVTILKKISQAIPRPKKLAIRWYYEDDDDDMLDTGKYISEIYNIPIEFIVIGDISAL
jgi:hypothetical protein